MIMSQRSHRRPHRPLPVRLSPIPIFSSHVARGEASALSPHPRPRRAPFDVVSIYLPRLQRLRAMDGPSIMINTLSSSTWTVPSCLVGYSWSRFTPYTPVTTFASRTFNRIKHTRLTRSYAVWLKNPVQCIRSNGFHVTFLKLIESHYLWKHFFLITFNFLVFLDGIHRLFTTKYWERKYQNIIF